MLKWLHVLIYLNNIIKFNSFSYLLRDFTIEMYRSGPNEPKCYVDVANVTIYATLQFLDIYIYIYIYIYKYRLCAF